MGIISNLKISAQQRPKHQPAILRRRNKLAAALHDQLELAKADNEGREYLKKYKRYLKNPATGEYLKTEVQRRPKAWYWIGDDGKVYIQIKYGTRVIEIAKGKSSIEIGDVKHLIPVIEVLKQATINGEVDSQINQASDEVSQRFAKQLKQKNQT